MKGLELCRKYYEEIGRPVFEKEMPGIFEYAAVGLVGEGSECFGFDDEISRDHDWGPGFCIWLTADDYEKYGTEAGKIYDSLPKSFMGFERLRQLPESAGRVGVFRTDRFYEKFLGLGRAPQSINEWRMVPEVGLYAASNGELWADPAGEFTKIRQQLLAFYPEDVRKKKLAMHAALAAQAGQYNYYRIIQRGDRVAAMQALAVYVENIQSMVFLLNLKYKPYYKWAHRAMKELPILGKELSPLIEKLYITSGPEREDIERVAALIINELKKQGLSLSGSDFLLHHAEVIQSKIENTALKAVHIMSI